MICWLFVSFSCLSQSRPSKGEAAGGTTRTNVVTDFRVAPSEATPEAIAAYILQPRDMIKVTVFGEDDLQTQQAVDIFGRVDLPLLGLVKLGGKSSKQAQQYIQDLYEKDLLVNPRVSLVVVERAKTRFSVLGQVRSPGIYEVPSQLKINIMDAIAMAGGYTRIAGKITIKRGENAKGKGKGKRQTIKYSVRKLKRTPISKLPKIHANDTIIVGESLF